MNPTDRDDGSSACIAVAARFVADQPGGIDRILHAHRRRSDSSCTHHAHTATPWPCSAVTIAHAAQQLIDSATSGRPPMSGIGSCPLDAAGPHSRPAPGDRCPGSLHPARYGQRGAGLPNASADASLRSKSRVPTPYGTTIATGISVSIGGVTIGEVRIGGTPILDHQPDLHALFDLADTALYNAKHAARGAFRISQGSTRATPDESRPGPRLPAQEKESSMSRSVESHEHRIGQTVGTPKVSGRRDTQPGADLQPGSWFGATGVGRGQQAPRRWCPLPRAVYRW